MTNQELIKILSGMLKVPALTKQEIKQAEVISEVIKILEEAKP